MILKSIISLKETLEKDKKIFNGTKLKMENHAN